MATRTEIRTDRAPAAIGPYSQAVTAAGWVFTAGQIGLDPATGALADGFDAQASRALENLGAVLDAAGAGWGDVVKTTVFLADLGDYGRFNEIYGKVVTDPFPARSALEAAGLPKGARVEVEAVAAVPDVEPGRVPVP